MKPDPAKRKQRHRNRPSKDGAVGGRNSTPPSKGATKEASGQTETDVSTNVDIAKPSPGETGQTDQGVERIARDIPELLLSAPPEENRTTFVAFDDIARKARAQINQLDPAWVTLGLALDRIAVGRLYRFAGFDTFDGYIQSLQAAGDEPMSRSAVYECRHSAQIWNELRQRQKVRPPTHKTHYRILGRLESADQAETVLLSLSAEDKYVSASAILAEIRRLGYSLINADTAGKSIESPSEQDPAAETKASGPEQDGETTDSAEATSTPVRPAEPLDPPARRKRDIEAALQRTEEFLVAMHARELGEDEMKEFYLHIIVRIMEWGLPAHITTEAQKELDNFVPEYN